MKATLKKIFGIRKIFYIPILIALMFGYISAWIYPNVEVKHVYKVFPVFIIYMDKVKPNKYVDFAYGKTIAMIIMIDNNYKNEDDILKHEIVHVKQSYRTIFLNNIIELFSIDFHVRQECEAYASGIILPLEAQFIAEFLKEQYNPSYTKTQLRRFIIQHWKKTHK